LIVAAFPYRAIIPEKKIKKNFNSLFKIFPAGYAGGDAWYLATIKHFAAKPDS
jgi:hypothetical protein